MDPDATRADEDDNMSASMIAVIAAAGANGLLAGASLDQSIKQLPRP